MQELCPKVGDAVIQEHIKKPLAEELLFGKLVKGGLVKISVKDDAIPLEKAGKPTRGLNPVVEVDGRHYLLKPEFMAAVPVSHLSKSLENLSHRREDFIPALDLLFTGV